MKQCLGVEKYQIPGVILFFEKDLQAGNCIDFSF